MLKCSGESVGAIIKKNNKILLLDRRFFPFGWACPAGHIDGQESPKQAVVREVEEETGLKVVKAKPVLRRKKVPNECSKKTKFHDWWIFKCQHRGRIRLNKREARGIGWFASKEIKKLELEPIWKKWFK